MKIRNFIFCTLLASSLMLPALSAYAKHEAEPGDDRGGNRTCQSITVKRDDSKANDHCRRSNDDSLTHQRHGADNASRRSNDDSASHQRHSTDDADVHSNDDGSVHQRHGGDDAGGHGNDDGSGHK